MSISVFAIGGYGEIGKNMTAIKVDDEIIIFDMGIRLDRIVLHEDTAFEKKSSAELISIGALPDDTMLHNMAWQVKAIVISHGHLDHVGALTKLTGKYKAPIITTPYTAALAENMIAENDASVKNKIIVLQPGKRMQITPSLDVEFVTMTHSIVDTVMVALHTPYGAIAYANDFKLDNTPVIGKKPDYARLKALGDEGVLALIIESTRVQEETKTPSEMIAKKMLENCLYDDLDEKTGTIITTFSSHLARIDSICEIVHKIHKKTLLLGRSMSKYSALAINQKIVEYQGDVTISNGKKETEKLLKKVMIEGKENYVAVMTGHQGEPTAMLSRLAENKLPYKLEKEDRVIFSSNIIPTPINESNRYILDDKLRRRGARLIKDIHVSGHASRADHEVMIKLLQPENIIPCHGEVHMMTNYIGLAETFGYALNYNAFILRNGQEFKLPI